MKTGMNVLLWTAHLVPEQFPVLEKIKKAGYDGVELPCFDGKEEEFAVVGKELKRLGLGCTAVTVMTPEANPVSADPAVRKAAVERIKWAVRCTKAAGGDVLCGPVHSALGVFTGSGPTDEEKKRCADVIRAGAEEASAAKVKIAVEFLCRFESYVVTTAQDAVALAKRVDHPAVGVLYDTFHANIEEKDPIGALTSIGKYLCHFHVSENDRGTPGKGHVPWDATFAALKRMNYSGWLTIEAFGRAMPEIAAATRVWRDFAPNADEVYLEGLKMMKRMMAE